MKDTCMHRVLVYPLVHLCCSRKTARPTGCTILVPQPPTPTPTRPDLPSKTPPTTRSPHPTCIWTPHPTPIMYGHFKPRCSTISHNSCLLGWCFRIPCVFFYTEIHCFKYGRASIQHVSGHGAQPMGLGLMMKTSTSKFSAELGGHS